MTSLHLSNYDAAIFDMDGTMINNMEHHQVAWREFLKRHDIDISEEEFKKRISGKKNDEIFEIVFGHRPSDEKILTYSEEKESIYRELYRPELKEIDGLRSTIDEIKSLGKKLAIATTAPKKNRDMCLEALALTDSFSVILGDEHVTKGKPHPEIYVNTARELGVEPARCVAFEDTPSGVQSAKDAGMYVVGILSTHSQNELKNADIWINNYTELELIN